MDGADAARVLLDVLHRVHARGGSPPAVNLKGHQLGVGVFHHPVQQVLALVHVELACVVVVANGDAVLLGQLAQPVQVGGQLFGFLRRVEGRHGAGHVLHAKLRQIGQVLLDEVQPHMGGNSGDAGLFQGVHHVLGGNAFIVPHQLHAGVAQLPGLADFVQEGQPAVKAKGINLQIDVVHGKHILLL